MNRPQSYPRIDDDSDKFAGFLDESELVPHVKRIGEERLKKSIIHAIDYAASKSSRAILDEVSDDMTQRDIDEMHQIAGSKLFDYFVKYSGDPAATAFECCGRHFSLVAKEQFHNRSLQKERMNSGWRYQAVAFDLSKESGRFASVSDINSTEADFNAVIRQRERSKKSVSIYVSVKNRSNTMGGQDWPKAIRALEAVASSDKNRSGPYICVFGIAIDHGSRIIKRTAKTREPYSVNTEVWMSDFFWPFFTNFSYLEVIDAFVTVLEAGLGDASAKVEYEDVPEALLESFGKCCKDLGLVNQEGIFHDARRLARLFVMGTSKFKKNEK